MVLLNKEQIKEVIPHRDPFLLIDEVIALDPGKKCTARKFITPGEFWFQGHFPQYPVTPGVLMLEMLAQTAGVCALCLEENKGKLAFFGGLNNVRFREQVLPDSVLTLEIELVKMKANVGKAKGIAKLGEKVAVTAEMTFALSDKQG